MKTLYTLMMVLVTTVMAVNPDAETKCQVGIQMVESEEWSDAVTYLTQAISIDPEFSAPYYYRAIAYNNLDHNDLAIIDLTKLIELEPAYAGGYYWRGRIHYWLGHYELAVQDLQVVVELGEGDNDIYSMMEDAERHIQTSEENNESEFHIPSEDHGEPRFMPADVYPSCTNIPDQNFSEYAVSPRNIQGSVTLWVYVADDGQIDDVKIYSSSGNSILDQNASNRVWESIWTPAQIDGETVGLWTVLSINYDL